MSLPLHSKRNPMPNYRQTIIWVFNVANRRQIEFQNVNFVHISLDDFQPKCGIIKQFSRKQ